MSFCGTLILFAPGIFLSSATFLWQLVRTTIGSVPVLTPLNLVTSISWSIVFSELFTDPFYLFLLNGTNASINLQRRLALTLITISLLFADKSVAANNCLSQIIGTSLLSVTNVNSGRCSLPSLREFVIIVTMTYQ